MAHYSNKCQQIDKMSQRTESPFVQQPVIPKTKPTNIFGQVQKRSWFGFKQSQFQFFSFISIIIVDGGLYVFSLYKQTGGPALGSAMFCFRLGIFKKVKQIQALFKVVTTLPSVRRSMLPSELPNSYMTQVKNVMEVVSGWSLFLVCFLNYLGF